LTAEQEAANANVISRLRRESTAALQRRIECKELMSLNEFQTALSVDVEHIRDAVKSGGMFAISGPAGEEFYPAFYADKRFVRSDLESAAKALTGVSADSKFHFFTSKSTLLAATPLEALKEGRLENVLTAAAAFSER
jgi:hypothetical protein